MIEIRLKCEECGKKSKFLRVGAPTFWSHPCNDTMKGNQHSSLEIHFGLVSLPEGWRHVDTSRCAECAQKHSDAIQVTWKEKEGRRRTEGVSRYRPLLQDRVRLADHLDTFQRETAMNVHIRDEICLLVEALRAEEAAA